MFPMYFLPAALLILFAVTCLAETVTLRGSIRDKITSLSTVNKPQKRSLLPPAKSEPRVEEDLHLLDVVLVASVDGKFHALNRTSGQPLWSMNSVSAAPGSAPATLGPLVRTSHPDIDPDAHEDEALHQELYVVEPQSGDIYVMSTPTSPLQKLDFSMSQLVDMSPFSFPGDDGKRSFVGRKETSLLLIDLDTGKVKATINSECPWDPFESLSETDPADLDLDDLESSAPPPHHAPPTEVYIGRTDYHVSIHTRPTAAVPNPPIQNLSFSVYGPNNQDQVLQSMYRRSADDTHIQALHDGHIFSFKHRGETGAESGTIRDSRAQWAHKFRTPVVAVFDVVKTVGRQHPFVLLQPRPRLEEFLPTMDLPAERLHNLDAAYVGLLEETGSLFAMSPDRFPLVVFGDRSLIHDRASIDPPPGTMDDENTLDREQVRTLRQLCADGFTDRRCLTGVRPLGETRGSLGRLLDGVPTAERRPLPDLPFYNVGESAGAPSSLPNNLTMLPPWAWWRDAGASTQTLTIGGTSHAVWALTSFVLALTYGAVWFVSRRTRSNSGSNSKHAPAYGLISVANSNSTSSAGTPVVLLDDSVGQVMPSDAAQQDAKQHVPDESGLVDAVGVADGKQAPLDVQTAVPDSPMAPKSATMRSDEAVDGDDSDKEGDANAGATPKKKGMRRRRGRGGKGKKSASNDAGDDLDENKENVNSPELAELAKATEQDNVGTPAPSSIIVSPSTSKTSTGPSLIVSDTILGFGSHGTVVFKGSLQGRAVAVKRLLQDFVTLASREVSVLQESDDHPNVIRYYYQEAQSNFLYIALELCPASLADVVESPDQFRDISLSFDPKRALRQVASGLRHLHSLKIIHRDIKPQNILIASPKGGHGQSLGHRMLISDFGLCKKLEVDQTSFLPTAHGAMAAGTVGWRAPEILRGEVKLDDAPNDDQSQSSRGSTGTATGGSGTANGKPTRLTKSVDIFALGCLFYYTLTNGSHPFGDRFEREVNILKNEMSLEGLERFGEEGSEAADLIEAMLHPEASSRPDTTTCLLHPFFWDPGRRLTFLQDASDRFEIMCRDPRDPNLITLEKDAFNIVGADWHARLDKVFIENLGKFRKYDGRSVQDLLRALRNKKHHYQDLPEHVKRHLGPMPEGFLAYFTRRYPRLFLHVHGVIACTSLHRESMFRSYFELAD